MFVGKPVMNPVSLWMKKNLWQNHGLSWSLYPEALTVTEKDTSLACENLCLGVREFSYLYVVLGSLCICILCTFVLMHQGSHFISVSTVNSLWMFLTVRSVVLSFWPCYDFFSQQQNYFPLFKSTFCESILRLFVDILFTWSALSTQDTYLSVAQTFV